MIELFNPLHMLTVALVMAPIERLAPVRPHLGLARPRIALDLCYFFLNGALITLGLVAVLTIAHMAGLALTPDAWRAALAGLPLWAAVPLAIIISDLGFYAAHRTFHAVPALWRFHAIHHSIEQMDWLAAHRVHPLDQIATKGAALAPLFFFGFDPKAMAIAGAIYAWHAIFLHANIRITFGWLEHLIATPRFHHWHHANEDAAHDRNFAGQIALIDKLFGTMHLPAKGHPSRYGTDTPTDDDYVGQLAQPFRPLFAAIGATFARDQGAGRTPPFQSP